MSMLTKEQIVTVAKDVIAQITLHKYTAFPGVYVKHGSVKRNPSLAGYQIELQSLLDDPGMQSCDVCAIGAVVISKARLYDDFKAYTSEDGSCWVSESRGHATNILGGELSGNIEAAFEGWRFYDTHDTNDWCLAYPNAEDRLVAIMHNLIRNGGEFNRMDYGKEKTWNS